MAFVHNVDQILPEMFWWRWQQQMISKYSFIGESWHKMGIISCQFPLPPYFISYSYVSLQSFIFTIFTNWAILSRRIVPPPSLLIFSSANIHEFIILIFLLYYIHI